MRFIRFVRISVPFVMLGLAGILLGCSGQPSSSTPPTPEVVKQRGEEIRKARLEQQEARSQAAKERASMKDMMKGRPRQ
jgi:hypothetical protein